MLLALGLHGCDESAGQATVLLPTEEEFLEEHARLACRWAAECGVAENTGRAGCRWTSTNYDGFGRIAFSEATLAWKERCHAVFDSFRAAECLTIWKENGVDCTVSFYSGCAAGDWYDLDEACR